MTQKEKMISLVQGQLEAYNERNLEKFCSFYHPEVKAFSIGENEAFCEGISKFREIYTKRFETTDLHCHLKSRIVLENTVIDEEWVTPMASHVAAIYQFKDNLIHRIWFAR